MKDASMKQNSILEKMWDTTMLALMLVSLYMVFIWVPNEKTMGIVQRIFYFHVPSAWVAFLAFGMVFFASIMYLIRRDDKWDIMAANAAELGIIFCSIVLVTGPIWAKPVWGIWWTWDPRLTLTLVLWLIYVAYTMLRVYVQDESKRARLCAVVGIIGFLDVPLVYMSIRWWRTQHPSPVIAGGDKSGLAPEMFLTLMICLLTFTVLFFYLLRKRYQLARAEEEINHLYNLVNE
jgi:heme exporter protein C